MKLFLWNSWIHPKNRNALMNYKTIEVITDPNKIDECDYIYSPGTPINISKYHNKKFIFGPHFSVFPNRNLHSIKSSNAVYIQPSNWAKDCWKEFPECNGLRIEVMPFGVDTERFRDIKPINQRDKVFIYYKRRNPSELQFVKDFLSKKGIDYIVFDYVHSYDETAYLNTLQDSKFGIVLDAHESQGFALEEALSCNVPLLVWNVSTMKQEYGSNYSDYNATSIPYWDERCGKYFYKQEELDETFDNFISNIFEYKPREYILENLSYNVCEKKFIELLNNI
jgi:hypothetical protein